MERGGCRQAVCVWPLGSPLAPFSTWDAPSTANRNRRGPRPRATIMEADARTLLPDVAGQSRLHFSIGWPFDV